MNHISIEGMDGVGKTTTCELLAKKLGYKFVEKPLRYLLDKDEGSFTEYQRIARIVNSDDDRTFTAWYYGLNNIYLYDRFKGQNIVTDRHIVSNYCWSGTEHNMDIYDLIIKKIGLPKLTVILYARPDVIASRLRRRNVNDKDLKKVSKSEKAYERMIYFCKLQKLPFIVVDTSEITPEAAVEIIVNKLGELE